MQDLFGKREFLIILVKIELLTALIGDNSIKVLSGMQKFHRFFIGNGSVSTGIGKINVFQMG